jgi:tetratricopeptide (TPR) repeat protein
LALRTLRGMGRVMLASRALLAPRAITPSLASGVCVRNRALGFLALCSFLLALSIGQPAARADASALPAGYTETIDEAVEEATRGNFAEARALFARAHALYPNARTLRGLGMMAYELRLYGESISYYERALLSSERPLDAALRADAEAQMERARRFVAELKLALTPPAVRISVDDRQVELSATGQIRLDPGPHTLVFEAPGYRSETRNVDVRGGESLLWTVSLPLASAQVGAPERHEEARDTSGRRQDQQPKRLYRNPWLWVGVAVAAGALATGLGVGLTQRSKKSVADEPMGGLQTPPEGIISTLVKR